MGSIVISVHKVAAVLNDLIFMKLSLARASYHVFGEQTNTFMILFFFFFFFNSRICGIFWAVEVSGLGDESELQFVATPDP